MGHIGIRIVVDFFHIDNQFVVEVIDVKKSVIVNVKTVYICPMRMTISGLPRHFDKFDLQRLFNPFGWVDYTRIIIDPLSGLSRGKGIVEMKQDDQAKQAMAALQGKVLGANPLNIKEAKEGGPKTW
jgi:RNA recognition motif-containing protein